MGESAGLHLYASEGDIAGMERSLAGLSEEQRSAQLNEHTSTGKPAMHTAAEQGHAEMVAWLSSHGADLSGAVRSLPMPPPPPQCQQWRARAAATSDRHCGWGSRATAAACVRVRVRVRGGGGGPRAALARQRVQVVAQPEQPAVGRVLANVVPIDIIAQKSNRRGIAPNACHDVCTDVLARDNATFKAWFRFDTR